MLKYRIDSCISFQTDAATAEREPGEAEFEARKRPEMVTVFLPAAAKRKENAHGHGWREYINDDKILVRFIYV